MSGVREAVRCVACGVLACEDIKACKLRQEVRRAGDALDAWNDGAIFGAILAGVEFDVYEARLHEAYDRAKERYTDYLGHSVTCERCGHPALNYECFVLCTAPKVAR